MILSDTNIMEFSNNLNDSRFFIRAEYTSFSSWPVIGFYLNTLHSSFMEKNHGNKSWGSDFGRNEGRIAEPEIEYLFSFSVCEKRIDDFYEILDRIISKGVENLVFSDGREYKNILLTDSIINSKNETTHSYINRSYKKIDYHFIGKTSNIMAYVQAIKNAIEFFSLIWGYTETGEETCLLKYPIGSIVSPVNDKSKDVLVFGYYYEQIQHSFSILYEVYEILSDEKSPILKYGHKLILRENDLTLSRTAQVNSILN